MKKVLILILSVVLVCAFAGCRNQNKVFLPGTEDFLSVNTITGLLNRYETVCCFEKLVNTDEGADVTRSWQYHQEGNSGIVQVGNGDETTLFYNRLLLTTADDGQSVDYGVYLNESEQPEAIYFDRANLFGQEYGAEITYLDEQIENFRFQSKHTITAHNLEDYSVWGAEIGDEIIGTYTVAADDLRILRSEVTKTHAGETELILVASWVYSRPLQLHDMWKAYAGDSGRKLITVKYAGDTEKRYFFPQGVTPELYTDDGHQLFLDKDYQMPYIPEPVTGHMTLYYR